MQEYCIETSINIRFGYLLESPHRGDSNKYPKHMFYKEIRYIPFCPLRILYNSKFILMATSLETNAVVVTRVHCTALERSTVKRSVEVGVWGLTLNLRLPKPHPYYWYSSSYTRMFDSHSDC